MGLLVNGGGGVPKSRLVAAATAAANVLKNTFFVNSTGARTEGTMTDNQGQTVTASAVDKSGSNIRMKIPARACYDTSSYVQKAASDFGDAAAGDILTGKKATSSNGLNMSGTMSDYSGQAKTASAVDKNGTNIRMKVPNTGKYNTSSYIQSAASNFGNATAAQVLNGRTFTSSSGFAVSGTLTYSDIAGTPTTGNVNQTDSSNTSRSEAISVTNGATYVFTFNVLDSNSYGATSVSLSGCTVHKSSSRVSSYSEGYNGQDGNYRRMISTFTFVITATAATFTVNYMARPNTYTLVKLG